MLGQIKTASAQVASILKEAIVSGRFRPGERLPEIELQKSLGVSRSPIREAFRELQAEGLITIIPNKGVVVTKLNRKDLEELYELRILLESYAIRRSCKIMTENDLREMRTLIKNEEKLVGNEDIMAYLEMSHAVHECFIRKCNNMRLQRLVDMLRKNIWAVHILTCSYRDRVFAMESVNWHKKILSELTRRNASGAEKALKTHLKAGRQELTFLLKEQGELSKKKP